jgi:hypothetical protein
LPTPSWLRRARKGLIADDLGAITSHRIESETERLQIPAYAGDLQLTGTRKVCFVSHFEMEIIKEARVGGKEITLTYRLPWPPASVSKKSKNGQFFTV